jgi:hypothetical protein
MTTASKPAGGSSERMSALIDTLEISDFRKDLLRQRWLNQMGWMSRSASKARRRFMIIRVPVVAGGVAIPALITILLAAGDETTIDWLLDTETWKVRLAAFVVSALVAIFAALEDTLRFGETWRRYRRTAELLKTLGWQYLGLSGAFKRYPSHDAAFVPFTERVEDVLNEDVEGYLGAMATDPRDQSRHEVIA